MKIFISSSFIIVGLIFAATIPVAIAETKNQQNARKISLVDAFRDMASKIKRSVSPKAQPVKTVSVSSSYDVRQHSIVTGSRLNMFLRGVLRDKGDLFVEVARKNNICPIVFAAISMHESANGSSKFARERNNVFGIYLKGKYHSFDSVDSCIEYAGKLLGGKLYCGGKNYTVRKIQQVYCPVGANNDPRNLNKYWLNGVLDKMKLLWGQEIYVLASN